MESQRNTDLPQVSHSHNPLASIRNLDRSQGQESHTPDTIAIVTISNDPSYHRWLIGTLGKPPLALLPAWSISAALSLVERLQAAHYSQRSGERLDIISKCRRAIRFSHSMTKFSGERSSLSPRRRGHSVNRQPATRNLGLVGISRRRLQSIPARPRLTHEPALP
jgi:hypothetical protein